MRVFAAIDIEDSIREAIEQLQKDIEGRADIRAKDVRWVNPRQMHMTLKFLGYVKDEQVRQVCSAVEKAVQGHLAFDLDIESVGYFGRRSAKVLWVGTGEGTESLNRLQADIELHLAQAGWEQDKRKFAGHLTLCRVKDFKAGRKLAALSEDYRQRQLGTTSVQKVTVYQSELTPDGPIYAALGNYDLQ